MCMDNRVLSNALHQLFPDLVLSQGRCADLFCSNYTIVNDICPAQLITYTGPPRDVYVSGKSLARA